MLSPFLSIAMVQLYSCTAYLFSTLVGEVGRQEKIAIGKPWPVVRRGKRTLKMTGFNSVSTDRSRHRS